MENPRQAVNTSRKRMLSRSAPVVFAPRLTSHRVHRTRFQRAFNCKVTLGRCRSCNSRPRVLGIYVGIRRSWRRRSHRTPHNLMCVRPTTGPTFVGPVCLGCNRGQLKKSILARRTVVHRQLMAPRQVHTPVSPQAPPVELVQSKPEQQPVLALQVWPICVQVAAWQVPAI